jgi:hypothetical protein
VIRLNFPTAPYWLELGSGIRLLVNPPTTVLMATARASARTQLEELRAAQQQLLSVGATVEGLPDLNDPNVVQGHLEALTTQAFARYAIADWQGVLEADGTPAPVTAANIAKLMNIGAVAQAFVALYLVSVHDLENEGNGSAPASNGTSAAGANTATTAAPSAEIAA